MWRREEIHVAVVDALHDKGESALPLARSRAGLLDRSDGFEESRMFKS